MGDDKKCKLAEYPFTGYRLYVVYHKTEKRRYAVLVPIDKYGKLKRTSVSYARYLMCVKEGRLLKPYEHVDHIDDDKLHDDIDNLQILTQADNNRKEAKKHGRVYAKLKCPNCGKIFEKPKNRTFLAVNGTYSACSRKCCCEFNVLLKKYPDSKLVRKKLSQNVVEIYVKH